MLIRLHKNAGVSVQVDSPGGVIRCEEGIIWLTQTGDPVDHFLQSREEFVISRKGTVIVEARRDACISLLTCSETGRAGMRQVEQSPRPHANP